MDSLELEAILFHNPPRREIPDKDTPKDSFSPTMPKGVIDQGTDRLRRVALSVRLGCECIPQIDLGCIPVDRS